MPQFPRQVTTLPQWDERAQAAFEDIKANAHEEHGAGINSLHPACQDLRYLKEAFEEAATTW
eukprot:15454338-Alexandrium_andersonii.AAC.1